jgi:hypothetical protein
VLAKFAVATIVVVAGPLGSGLVAQSNAATPPRTLFVRPGIGIGPIRIGETLTVLKEQFPGAAVHNGGYEFRIGVKGDSIGGGLNDNRVVGVWSNKPDLALGAQRLRNHQTSESQRLIHAGWRSSSCLTGHTLIYRRDPKTHKTTAIVWTNGAVLAEVLSHLPSTWTQCASSGSASS